MAKGQQSKKTAKSDAVVSPQVQDVALDGVEGVYFHAGTVRMNLFTNAFDPKSGESERVITQRVTMPLLDFITFAETLNQIKNEIARVSAEQAQAGQAAAEDGKGKTVN